MGYNGNKSLALAICLLTVLSGALTLQVWLVGAPSTISAPTSSGTGYFDYVLVIMLENKDYGEVIGSTSSPYLNSLASQYALATDFRNSDNGGSLPNYLTLLAGSGVGWAACNAPPSQCSGFKALTPSLVESFDAKGLSWKAYMEGMPSNCYAGNSEYYSGPDGSVYYPRHNPFIYLTAVINNQSDCNKVVPAGSSDSALLTDLSSTSTSSNFMWLTPNGCNQSHDCSAAQADTYLSGLIPKILSSTIFRTQNAALFLTWDEASSGNHIPTILAGPAVKTGFQSNAPYEHYSMLKTIETNWNLASLTANDANAVPMTEFFRTNSQSQNMPSTDLPQLTGWGGVELSEAGQLCPVSGTPNSTVFQGECMSSMELHMVKFKTLGYNTIRVDFVTQCNSPKPQMGPYSAANLDRAIKLAKHYGLWIIVDWHGYHDLEPSYLACWLSSWKPIVQQFTASYDQLIWEPENEPTGGTNDAGGYLSLAELTTGYQQWVSQTRSLGDTHYISVPNLCISTCNNYPALFMTGWPIIRDPIQHIFINIHPYMYYPYWSPQGWNNATAEKAANMFFQAVKHGMQLTGYRALATEGGADWISGSPSDIVIGSGGGDVQYTKTNLHFIQTIISLFDHNNPRIGWVFWPAGIWTQCCSGGGLYGALEKGGWGTHIAPTPGLQSSISTNSTSVQTGQRFSVSGSAQGGIGPYNYTWTFGDGANATGVSVSHNYALANDYKINLKVTDSTGITSISQIQLTANVTPHNETVTTSSPIINVPPVRVASLGTPVHFTVTAYSRSPRIIILSALGLPKGANFTTTPGNPVSGEFSWAPLDTALTGLHSVSFKAQESGTTSFDIKSVTIQVISTARPCLICDLVPFWASFYLLSAGGIIGGAVSFSGLAIVRAYRPRRNLLPVTNLRSRIKLNQARSKISKGLQNAKWGTASIILKPGLFANRKIKAMDRWVTKTHENITSQHFRRKKTREAARKTRGIDPITMDSTAGHPLRSRAS